MFVQGPHLSVRLFLVTLISVALIVLDVNFPQTERLRSWLGTALAPVVWLGHAPSSLVDWASLSMANRQQLIDENESLKAQLLVLQRRSEKYAALATENSRLRELLHASGALDDTVIVSEIIGVTPDPFSHEVIIDKGRRDHLSVGQAVLDAHGLMGQIIQTSEFTSRVLLISDSSNAVPVEVNRSGVRAILLGTGEPYRLDLVHVPDTADITVGDLLVSSGLGGRFPKGYPVATVTNVEHDPGEPFAKVEARPMAHLYRSQLVLVVFKQGVGDIIGTQSASPAGTQKGGH
ncbi:rod shape-determining protein MreC [Mangrovitalea sediminis]|uniref:rod shape-determining protein MreC n=1 Tax=Mangrovitalea sediminis TaxID=1982043 RepID=UPI000BE54D79|nr:rod shape-determining protein MreC [Mangrovitalea sediminis]